MVIDHRDLLEVPLPRRAEVATQRGLNTVGTAVVLRRFELAEHHVRVVEDLELPVVLAGGLRAKNLGQAVKTVQPWGVDVSSGVEAELRCKDMDAVRDFIEAARRVGESNDSGKGRTSSGSFGGLCGWWQQRNWPVLCLPE